MSARITALTGLLVFLAAGCASTARVLHHDGPVKVRPARKLHVLWHRRLAQPTPLEFAARERSRPAWDGERGWVFVGDRFGVVRALDAVGDERWVFEAEGAIEADLLLDGLTLYVVSSGGTVSALDSSNGQPIWEYRAGTELSVTPTLADGRLLVSSLGDTLLALDAKSGKFLWFHRRTVTADLTIRGAAGAAVAGQIVVTAYSDGTVVALDARDGREKWKHTVRSEGSFQDIDTTPVIDAGRVFVASYGGGVVALDLKTGKEIWRNDDGGAAVQISLAGGRLVVFAPNRVVAFRSTDGARLWSTKFTGGTPTGALLVGKILLVGTEEGPVYGVAVSTGKPVVAFAPGNGVAAAPAPTRDGLWVWSNGGWLYRLGWR